MYGDLNQDDSKALWRFCVLRASEFIVIVDRDMRIRFANQSVERAVHENDDVLPFLEGLGGAIGKVFNTGIGGELTVPGSGFTGTTGWYSVRLEPVVEGGRVGGVMVIARDITAAKNTQDLNACRGEVLEAISEGAPLKQVLTVLAKSIERMVPGMKCSVLLMDKDRKTLRFGAAPSLQDFYNEAIDGLQIGPGEGSCGTAAYNRTPVVVANTQTHPFWMGFKELALKAGLMACWSVPVINSEDEVLGTLALYYDEPREPVERERVFIDSAAQLTAIAIERHKHAEHKRLFVNELDHRVKNILTSVCSLAKQTLRASGDLDQFQGVFLGRMSTMAKAHEALALSQWRGLSLEEALDRVMEPFHQKELPQINTEGPEVSLSPEKVLPLCLAMHELGTNSLKYGALSSGAGRVSLSWTRDGGDNVNLVWSESGGPPVTPPEKTGVGTSLINGLIGFELHGEVDFHFREGGLDCRMKIPMPSYG